MSVKQSARARPGAVVAGLLLALLQPALARAQDALPATAAVVTETVVNPYGLQALWAQGDLVTRATLGVMAIMSVGSWYVIVAKAWEQRALRKSAAAAARSFWSAGSAAAGIQTLDEASAFRYIAQRAHAATEQHAGAHGGQIDLHTWVSLSVQRAVDTVHGRLQGGLAFLATVGSTAPFVGLFGTVWGIYHALTAIGVSGQASIDKVAGPVGEALIMTAFGLAAAVPAVMGYNWLIRRNRAVMEQVRAFGNDVHDLLVAGRRAG